MSPNLVTFIIKFELNTFNIISRSKKQVNNETNQIVFQNKMRWIFTKYAFKSRFGLNGEHTV